VADRLTEALVAPLADVDPSSWGAALAHAKAILAGLAVRRAGAGPFRVTSHEIRAALGNDAPDPTEQPPFAWTARTARRALGLAAVRLLVAGGARSPVEAVRARLEESALWVRDGNPCASQLDRWVAGLPPAGRTVVGAEAVTWATRLWCALDWPALGSPLAIGRDRWWDSPHSALLALRGRSEVRTERANLVVLSGPRRESVRAELALVTLVESLRARSGAVPGRVVGWWPDSGHLVRVEPEPAVLTLGAEAVGLVLAGTGTSVRSAA
jgi:hypothetical protein